MKMLVSQRPVHYTESMEKVSVIIPTYNRGYSIKRSVESVLAQDYPDFELIVVDDASTDDTKAILSDVSDPRFRYYKMPENGGASSARNKGVELASNELIAFNDSDDIWHRDKLTKYLKFQSENPDVVLLYGPYLTKRLGRMIRVPEGYASDELQGRIFPELLQRNTISTQTMMVSKAVFQKAGGFDPELPALEDWDFAIRVAKLGEIGYLDEVLVDVAASDDGLSSKAGNYYDARIRMLVKYKTEITELGLFDTIVKDIFERAERSGLLESVKQMLLLRLSENGI